MQQLRATAALPAAALRQSEAQIAAATELCRWIRLLLHLQTPLAMQMMQMQEVAAAGILAAALACRELRTQICCPQRASGRARGSASETAASGSPCSPSHHHSCHCHLHSHCHWHCRRQSSAGTELLATLKQAVLQAAQQAVQTLPLTARVQSLPLHCQAGCAKLQAGERQQRTRAAELWG